MSTVTVNTDTATITVPTREEWIAARVTEFNSDPATRDRAIATLLYDSLMLHQQLQGMMAMVQEKGIGGLMKAVLSNGR